TGTFPFCDSLDHLGHFARSMDDLALVYDALQGHDASDPVCAVREAEPVSSEIGKGVDGLRIAVAGGYFHADAEEGALSALAAAGRAVGASQEVDIPGV